MCMVNGGMWHVYKEVSFRKILMPDNMISCKGMYIYSNDDYELYVFLERTYRNDD